MGLLIVGCMLLASMVIILTPWTNQWGSTNQEFQAFLTGDHWIPLPLFKTTRAITIKASTAEVWPWLTQIGQGKAGFYSYTLLENLFGLQIRRTSSIHPEWQHLQIGDLVRLHPKGGFLVAELEKDQAIVLVGNSKTMKGRKPGLVNFVPEAVWSFHLQPHGEGCRLLVRTLSRPSGRRVSDFFLPYGMGLVSFFMEQKMLRSIKTLVEEEHFNQKKGLLQTDENPVPRGEPQW
ncbi:MAG: hypothetical protein AAGH79_01780 [Bacteroidota bacterium]